MPGDGTPNGWDINNPGEMAKDANIFTYTGQQKAGEFKIATSTGNQVTVYARNQSY